MPVTIESKGGIGIGSPIPCGILLLKANFTDGLAT